MIEQSENTFIKIHPSFKWQGEVLGREKLLQKATEYLQSDKLYLQKIGLFFKAWLNNQPTIEVQTSGSTGAPKKMRIKKQYMVNSAMATGAFFDLQAGTTALLCMPATYIAGKLMLVRALILGWEIDSVQPQANPLQVFQKTYDFCALTPYQLAESFIQLEFVKKIMVGGGAIPPPLYKRVQGVSSKIFETYAMTETLTHIAARPVNHLQNSKIKPPFKLLKDIEIKQDEQGCLIIKAPGVSDEIIYTRDIVEIQDKTSFWLKGRYDNLINSGGIKIQPERLEDKLATLINQRFFITGIADDTLGEKVVLFIEDHYSDNKISSLQSAIQNLSEIGRYERPKEIYYLPKFAETHSGKINRPQTIAAKFR